MQRRPETHRVFLIGNARVDQRHVPQCRYQSEEFENAGCKATVAIFLLDANITAHQRLNKHLAQRDDGCQTLQSTAGNLLEYPGHACIVLGIGLDEVDDGRRVKPSLVTP